MNQGTNERQRKQSPEHPGFGATAPRKLHPADKSVDAKAAGSEPDYFPGKPGGDLLKFRPLSRQSRARPKRPRLLVGWLQAH